MKFSTRIVHDNIAIICVILQQYVLIKNWNFKLWIIKNQKCTHKFWILKNLKSRFLIKILAKIKKYDGKRFFMHSRTFHLPPKSYPCTFKVIKQFTFEFFKQNCVNRGFWENPSTAILKRVVRFQTGKNVTYSAVG